MRIRTNINTFLLTLLPVACFGHVRPFFACTKSQDFNSDIGAHNGTRQCALGTILRHFFLTLPPVACFENIRPFFASGKSQEFISEKFFKKLGI